MARVYYTVEDSDFDDYMWVDAELSLGGEWLAEICAEDYHDNSNWEGPTDSFTFYLWTREEDADPVLLGEYAVLREYSPTFYACPQNSKE